VTDRVLVWLSLSLIVVARLCLYESLPFQTGDRSSTRLVVVEFDCRLCLYESLPFQTVNDWEPFRIVNDWEPLGRVTEYSDGSFLWRDCNFGRPVLMYFFKRCPLQIVDDQGFRLVAVRICRYSCFFHGRFCRKASFSSDRAASDRAVSDPLFSPFLLQMGSYTGGTPGRLLEITPPFPTDAASNFQAAFAEYGAGGPGEDTMNPHGLDVNGDSTIAISGDFIEPGTLFASSPDQIKFRDTIRIWRRSGGGGWVNTKTLTVPGAGGVQDVQVGPRLEHGWGLLRMKCTVMKEENCRALAVGYY
jgi:hypothetical protein